jgi:hypothetical protein
MKRHIIRRLLVFGLGIVLPTCGLMERGVTRETALLAQAGNATSALPALQGHSAVAELEKRGQYDSLREALEAARYRVYQERQQAAAWYAENPAQQIRARFTPDGVQVQVTSDQGQPRRIDMTLYSVGYGERQTRVSAARLKRWTASRRWSLQTLRAAGCCATTTWW